MDGDYARYDDNSGPKNLFGKTKNQREHPVAQKKPNAFGLYDMSGNVWEWCNDFYGNYAGGIQYDPTGPAIGIDRVLRGGSWNNNLGEGADPRSALRIELNPDYRNNGNGFRCVRSK